MMMMTLSDQLAPQYDQHYHDDNDNYNDSDDYDRRFSDQILYNIILTDELVSDLCGVGALSEEDILPATETPSLQNALKITFYDLPQKLPSDILPATKTPSFQKCSES